VQGAPPQIVSVNGPSNNNGSTNRTGDVPDAASSSSQGNRIAIIVGSVVGSCIVLCAIGFWFWKKKKRDSKLQDKQTVVVPVAFVGEKPVEDSGTTEYLGIRKHELDNGGEVFEANGAPDAQEVDGTTMHFTESRPAVARPVELHGHHSILELAGSPVERSEVLDAMHRRVSSPQSEAFPRKAASAPVSPLSPPLPQSSFRE
jgi:hypothetical protein